MKTLILLTDDLFLLTKSWSFFFTFQSYIYETKMWKQVRVLAGVFRKQLIKNEYTKYDNNNYKHISDDWINFGLIEMVNVPY